MPLGVVVLLVALAAPDALSDSLPESIGAEARRHLQALGDDDWQLRESAHRWLLRNHGLWATRVPADWRPPTAEGRWRWQYLRGRLAIVAELPTTLDREPLARARAVVRDLHRELGGAIVDALGECLESGDARVRQRAVEVLGTLPDIDLRQALAPLEKDPSPWVRRTLYSEAAAIDQSWHEELLSRALSRDESPGVRREVIRAARRLRSSEWLPQLRREWERSTPLVRSELALALTDLDGALDREVIHWMLRHGEYPAVIRALNILTAKCTGDDLPALRDVLQSPHIEARARAQDLIARNGSAASALELLPLVDDPDEDLFRFAVDTLILWQARDYYGDLDAAIRARPQAGVPWSFVAVEGEARAVHAVAREGLAEPRRAVEPGGH